MLDETAEPTATQLIALQDELEKARLRVQQLEHAVETHGRIGQAMGILMARYGIGNEAAFAALARVSQNHNLKLRRLADAVIATIGPSKPSLPRELTDALEDILRTGENPPLD